MASKYAPPTEFLRGMTEPFVELSFDELNQLVRGLPSSAKRHSVWWVNSRTATILQRRGWSSSVGRPQCSPRAESISRRHPISSMRTHKAMLPSRNVPMQYRLSHLIT